MKWIAQAIRDLGRLMDIPDLQLPETGSLDLTIEDRCTVHFQGSLDHLLVYSLIPWSSQDAAILERAQEFCHHQDGVQASLQDDTLIILTRLPNEDVTVPELDEAVVRLLQLQEDLS